MAVCLVARFERSLADLCHLVRQGAAHDDGGQSSEGLVFVGDVIYSIDTTEQSPHHGDVLENILHLVDRNDRKTGCRPGLERWLPQIIQRCRPPSLFATRRAGNCHCSIHGVCPSESSKCLPCFIGISGTSPLRPCSDQVPARQLECHHGGVWDNDYV